LKVIQIPANRTPSEIFCDKIIWSLYSVCKALMPAKAPKMDNFSHILKWDTLLIT